MKRIRRPAAPRQSITSRRPTSAQRTEQGQLLVFQFVFGLILTGSVGFMFRVLFTENTALAGKLFVGFWLSVLGLLGLACLYSGVMSLFDWTGFGGSATVKVEFIYDKRTVANPRRPQQYFLHVDRRPSSPAPDRERDGVWAMIRRYRVVGVDPGVYAQAVPGRFHEVVQSRWGRTIYSVKPVSSKRKRS